MLFFCIEHLLRLGEAAAEFKSEFEALAAHPNEVNRDMARNLLGKYFGVEGEVHRETARNLLGKYFS